MKINVTFLWLFLALSGLMNCSSDNEIAAEEATPNSSEDSEEILNPNGERYISEVFDDFTVTTDIEFATVVNAEGEEETLRLDFYEPEGDSETARPLLVFAHGGGLIRGDKEEGVFLAPLFCKSGYTVASINYRLADSQANSAAMLTGLIDAVNDMKAAVRFLKEGKEEFRIDVDQITIGGTSAGAFLALHYGYVESGEELAQIAGMPILTYFNENGGLEGNSGNSGSAFPVKAVFNFAGALADASLLDEKEEPIFSAHGTADDTVPYEKGEADESGIQTDGSKLIHDRANEVGVTNKLITIPNGSHNVVGECSNCLEELRSFLFELQ